MSKRVLITGAAGGLGSAATEELRRRGAQVVGLDLRADGDLIACDVRDQASVDRAVAEGIERLGGLDVLINNAGIGIPQSAGTRPDEGAQAVIDINLLGPWRVTGAALPALLESRGRVVNVASGLAHLTVPFAVAYTMSKRGIVAYSDELRAEFDGVLEVTTVYPGYLRTPIHDASTELGVGLEGAVPAEPVSAAARAYARAALDDHVRDLATTRRGTVNYAVLRHVPRRLLDRGVATAMRRQARRGAFSETGLAGDFARRLLGS